MDSILRLVEHTQREIVEAYPPGMVVLRVVTRRGLVAASDIALELDMKPSAVARLVRELEEEGHLRFAGDIGDVRTCLVEATPAGVEEVRQFDEITEEAAVAVLREWSPDDLRALTAGMDRLVADWLRFRRASALKVRPGAAR